MLAHNLELIHDNSLGRTSFADFWLLAMLENNPASHAGAMGCSTYIRFIGMEVFHFAGEVGRESVSRAVFGVAPQTSFNLISDGLTRIRA